MFNNAETVMINGKEVKSIVDSNGGVLYDSSETDVNISVIWDDVGYESYRPSNVSYVITDNNGNRLISSTLSSSNNYQESVHINNSEGVVLSCNLSGNSYYNVKINNFTITATFNIGSVPPAPPTPPTPPTQTEDIVGSIAWNDENNVHKVRPETVTVTLYANGVETESQQVPTSPGDTITYTFEDQPALNDNGDSIVYTVQWENINYYEATLSGLIITYKLVPREPMYYEDISGAITWVGDSASSRPSSVTVYLYRDGSSIEQRIVTAETNWNYSFGRVPMDDGYEYYYDYSIHVDSVSGYASRVDDFNITLISLNPIDDDDDSGDGPTPPTPGDERIPPIPEDIPERT